VIRSEPRDPDRTVRKRGEGAHLDRVRVTARLRRGAAQMVDAGEVLGLPWAGKQVDGARKTSASSIARSASSIASCCKVVARLESKQRRCASGMRRLRRYAVE
jgi:hypothetical protein